MFASRLFFLRQISSVSVSSKTSSHLVCFLFNRVYRGCCTSSLHVSGKLILEESDKSQHIRSLCIWWAQVQENIAVSYKSGSKFTYDILFISTTCYQKNVSAIKTVNSETTCIV